MATWYAQQWTGSATSVSHSVELATGVAAGSTLCYVEARVQITQSSNGLGNDTDFYYGPITQGLAIGAVAAGSGAPSISTFGDDDGAIWWGGQDAHTDNLLWAPSTADGFWIPYWTTTIRWRGARYFAASMDWYFISDSLASIDNQASGFFRLGFW